MTGKTLSHYQIIDELGRGGMGIVYKAKDTKLDRIVAIKVLPPAALASEDDRARFYREAKAAAALHHPNIASVFEIDEAVPEGSPADDTRPFIAMEYIDGKTLHDYAQERPLKISTARDIAVQVASALELAHSKNIVHRDIKSGNIMVDANGTAKILDFGLAQTAQSTKLTQMGSTVGTIAYMSPEQARGEIVDHRTDLWSLGVVLYEMISGSFPFPGDYEQAVVYSILNNEPEPLTAMRTGVPMQLEWIVNKLLGKNASDRYQSAKDLIVDLKHVDISNTGLSQLSVATTGPLQTSADRSQPPVSRTWLNLAAGLLLGALVASAGFLLSRSESVDEGLARVELSLPGMQSFAFPTMSPDNRYLAFLGNDGQQRDGVFLRDVATGELRYIEGSSVAGDREMGFSPNGERIAFNAGFNGGLYVSVVPSGIPERITEYGRFAVWEDNRTIVMTDDKPGGGESYRVNVLTREVEQIEVKDSQLEEGKGNVIKTMIPGSQRFFGHQITRLEGGNVGEVSNLFTLDARSGKVDVIERNAINPLYIAGGFLLYQVGDDDGRLVVRPIDTRTGQFTGPPRDALPSGQSTATWSLYTITSKGDLVYIPDTDGLFSGAYSVIWFVDLSDESAREIRTNLPAGSQPLFPSLSPDGNLVSFVSDNGQSGNLFVYDASDDVVYQYTFSGRHAGGSFSSDSKYLYYTKQVGDDEPAIYRRLVGESGQEESIAEGIFLPKVARDDSYILGTGLPPTYDFELLKITPSSLTVSELGQDTDGNNPISGMLADISPDGRYITYQSTDGLGFVATDLFVISADGQQKVQIPGVEGSNPVWSEDGRYIYYATYGNVFRLPVRTSPTFNILGEPEWVLTASSISGFDLHSDNNTLVVAASRIEFEQITGDADRVVWVQNWSGYLRDELRR